MTDWLLDTNIVSALMRQEPVVTERVARMASGDTLMISVVVHAEVQHGLPRTAEGRRKRSLVREYARLLRSLADILIVTRGIAETYATLRFALEQRGLPRADNDLWIAATAVRHDLILVTDDSHFSGVPDLQLANWLRELPG